MAASKKLLGGMLLLFLTQSVNCGKSNATHGGGAGGTVQVSGAPFPLSIASDKHSLVDAQGKPFLIQGEAAWSAIVNLSSTDATTYLDDRKNRGFNTLLVNLIEHQFSSQTPKWINKDGNAPFSNVNDFTTTNEAYFAHVDWFIQQAQNRGMLVLLAPSYMGYNCGAEGWCSEMTANGVAKLTSYGQYVGNRYKNFANIVWVEGGDHSPATTGSPSERDLVNAVANGIKTGDGGNHLHTAHWDQGTSGAQIPGITWLDLDSTYIYATAHTYVKSLSDYATDAGVRPFFMLESDYENENGSTTLQVRSEMIHPILSGSTGFVFGNFPIWSFWVPTDAAWAPDNGGYPGGWTTALASNGAKDVTRVGTFFGGIAWNSLRPDTGHTLMTAGYGTSGTDSFVLASATIDGKLAVAYYTAQLSPTVDLSKMSGTITARWYDPTSGSYSTVAGSPFTNSGTHVFTPGATNSGGATDWLLLLQAN